MDDVIAKVGDPIGDPPPPVFELVVSEHVAWVNPADYGLDRPGINPNDYFITSGDATEKARVLNDDLWRLAGELRREIFAIIAREHKCDIAHAHELFRRGIRPKTSGIAQPRKLRIGGVCWCGCGEAAKSRFMPGHDARFHALAKSCLRGETNQQEALEGLPHDESRDEFLAYQKKVRSVKIAGGLAAYETAIWEAAGHCRKLLNCLRLAKGTNAFLETEWNNHQLLCIPKNPRR